MPTFDHPEYLLVLLVLVPLIWFRHFWKGRGSTIGFAYSNWKGSRFVPPVTVRGILAAFGSIVFWAGFALILLALAGPARVSTQKVYLTRGIDIMIVLDCSPSMAAQDFGGTSRFDYAKSTIQNFIRQRQNDPIGLIAFGKDAALRVPPTIDYGALNRGLSDLHIMDMGDGTAIGLGLALAAVHLQHSSAAEKAVILLTDGENNAGEIVPEVAAGIVANMGIRIYTVAIGGNGEVPLEYVDPASGKLYRGTYSGHSGEELLKKIADATGGQSFLASSPGTLEAVFQSIDSLEKVEKRARMDVEKIPLVNLFVLVGLICILSDLFIRRFVIRELS